MQNQEEFSPGKRSGALVILYHVMVVLNLRGGAPEDAIDSIVKIKIVRFYAYSNSFR